MKHSFALALGVLFNLSLARPAAAAEPPNVLFIAVDDLNDWVGVLGGHPQVKTPHMDRLAKRGTLFLNAHCQSPVCSPSRTSFLTGLRPSTTGVYEFTWFRTVERWKHHPTVLQHFSKNKYRTLTTGKIFHDTFPPKPQRTDGSEVDVWGFHGGFNPRPAQRIVSGLRHRLVDWGVYPERDDEQDDWKVADWAIEQLSHSPRQPFFLCVGVRHPHVPLFASQEWWDLYPEDVALPPIREDDRWDTPRFSWYLHWSLAEPRLKWLRDNKQWRNKVRGYLASVSFADAMIGRVLDALDASGLAEHTIVVLLSDHGYHLGEKAISGKNTLWDRSTRVPLIIAGPGVTAGARCHRPVELIDLYPTLAELCGLPIPEGLDGHSLVPLLRDAAAPRPWPAITTHGPNNHGVRDEGFRYIRYANGAEELYDCEKDPHEWRNVAADPAYAVEKERLRNLLPTVNAAPLREGMIRLIELRDGKPYWQGEPIAPDDPIPEGAAS